MKRLIKDSSGVTLAEIVIVLAVVALLSVLVVSFTILCNGWTRLGVNRNKMMSSFTLVESGLKDFCSEFDAEECVFSTDGTTLKVMNRVTGEVYFASFDETLHGTAKKGDFVYPTDNITGVAFLLIENNRGGVMLRAIIYYSVPPLAEGRQPDTGSYNVAVALRCAGMGVYEVTE